LLATALADAFDGEIEPARADALIHAIAAGLLAIAPGLAPLPQRVLDVRALQLAYNFLSHHWQRPVGSDQLEKICGLSRFELCHQFKQRYGTSPYRFMVMRRLEQARDWLRNGAMPADVAVQAGFCDQAHMTRMFKAAFGLTPSQFAGLSKRGGKAIWFTPPRVLCARDIRETAAR
jgi:AraC-like DNA-binding protein